MMHGGPAEGRSAREKGVLILAGVGVYVLCYGALMTLFVLIAVPVSVLYVQISEVSVLSPGLFLSYVAIVAGATFVGWSVPRSAWLYGLFTGLCTQLAGVGPSTVTLSRLSIDLLRNPDIIHQGPGNPPLGVAEQWLVVVLMPVVLSAALGAVGGLFGGWLRRRNALRSRATVDATASVEEGS
jgi:hypothetical protein